MRDCKDRKLEAGDRVEIPALYDDGGKVVQRRLGFLRSWFMHGRLPEAGFR